METRRRLVIYVSYFSADVNNQHYYTATDIGEWQNAYILKLMYRNVITNKCRDLPSLCEVSQDKSWHFVYQNNI